MLLGPISQPTTMTQTDEDFDLTTRIGLSMVPGINISTCRRLLEMLGGSVKRFYELDDAEMHTIAGMRSNIVTSEYRLSLLEKARSEAEFVRNNNIEPLFMTDPGYPRRLAVCEDAPVMLYKLGRADLESRYMVAIVGTRTATAYGIEMTEKIVQGLAREYDKDVVIVSGLAYGIDVAAHRAALSAGVPTVAVTAHPLNTIYPADHRDVAGRIISAGGAIITEYSTSSRVQRYNFLARNRIIAGLCDAVIVVESDLKGGALNTINAALGYNRDTFAVPGRVGDKFSRGTNHLIETSRAQLITGAESVMDAMNWPRKRVIPDHPSLFVELTDQQRRVYDFIINHPHVTINELSIALPEIKYNAMANIIMQLELAGVLKTMPGNHFVIVNTV